MRAQASRTARASSRLVISAGVMVSAFPAEWFSAGRVTLRRARCRGNSACLQSRLCLQSMTSARPFPPAPESFVPLDIVKLLQDHQGENYDLHRDHVNPQFARVLKTIGFDHCYVKAQGAHLWD